MTAEAYDGDDPWYLRTLPGRTGDFLGHFIPGVCFAGLGLVLLLLALYRAQRLPPNKSFAEICIPESDPMFLRWFGIVNLVGTVVGTCYEILDSDPGFDPVAFTHSTLYASYFVVGICAFYESQGKLPLDTHRSALVIACLLQTVTWYAHGSMKKLSTDAALHIVLSLVNLANGAVVAYSIQFTDSVTAFLAGWALLVLQGLWIILAGLYECCLDLHMHDIAAILSMFSLGIFLSIVLLVVHCGPGLAADHQNAKFRGSFAVVPSRDDGEDDNGGTP